MRWNIIIRIISTFACGAVFVFRIVEIAGEILAFTPVVAIAERLVFGLVMIIFPLFLRQFGNRDPA